MTKPTVLFLIVFFLIWAVIVPYLLKREEAQVIHSPVPVADVECDRGHAIYLEHIGWVCGSLAIHGPNIGHDSITGICFISKGGENIYLDNFYCAD